MRAMLPTMVQHCSHAFRIGSPWSTDADLSRGSETHFLRWGLAVRLARQPTDPHRAVGQFTRGVKTGGNEWFDTDPCGVSQADQATGGKCLRGQLREHALE